jgi:Lipoprotein amino terminal region
MYMFAVGAAFAESGWKQGTEYRYQLKGRTFAALHQVDNQYTGILLRALVTVVPKSSDVLNIRVSGREM